MLATIIDMNIQTVFMIPELYTVRETAEKLNIPIRELYMLLKYGLIQPTIGTAYHQMFTQEDIDRAQTHVVAAANLRADRLAIGDDAGTDEIDAG